MVPLLASGALPLSAVPENRLYLNIKSSPGLPSQDRPRSQSGRRMRQHILLKPGCSIPFAFFCSCALNALPAQLRIFLPLRPSSFWRNTRALDALHTLLVITTRLAAPLQTEMDLPSPHTASCTDPWCGPSSHQGKMAGDIK